MKQFYYSVICILFLNSLFSQDGTLDNTFGTINSTPGFYFQRIMSYGETNNGIGNTISVSENGRVIIGATEEKRASYSSPLEYSFGFHPSEGIGNDNYSGVAVEECTNSIILSNGKSILIGNKVGNSIFNIKDIQMQFNSSNGAFDSDVSSLTGRKTINLGYNENIYSIKEYNNKLYAGGYLDETSTSNNDSYFVIIRFDLLGNIDTTFGTNGYIKQNIIGYSIVKDIFIQQDSKIIVVVPSDSGLGSKVIRYLNNGNLDNTFGTNGIVSLSNSTGYYSNKIIVQNDNKILISGTLQNNSPLSVKYTLTRLNENGSLDTSFASNGIFNMLVGSGNGSNCTDMKLLSNGKIILAGNINNNTGFGILRLNTDGTLDSTFGSNGVATVLMTSLGYTNIVCNSIAIKPSNKILIVGGAKSNFTTKNEIFTAQLNNSSTLSNQDFIMNNFIIYPNPAKEFINLSSTEYSQYEILDLLGKIVLKGNSENHINVSSLTKGVYVLKLKNRENTINQKFIKE